MRACIAGVYGNACAVECSRSPNRPKLSHCRINGAGAGGAAHMICFISLRIPFFAGHGGQERYCRKLGRLLRMQLMTCSLFALAACRKGNELLKRSWILFWWAHLEPLLLGESSASVSHLAFAGLQPRCGRGLEGISVADIGAHTHCNGRLDSCEGSVSPFVAQAQNRNILS